MQNLPKIRDNKGDKKLTSTEKGRGIIVEWSKQVNAKLLEGVFENQYVNI